MNPILMNVSHSFVFSDYPINSVGYAMDKIAKIAIVTTVAIAVLALLAMRFTKKIENWIKTPDAKAKSALKQIQEGKNISLNDAKKRGQSLTHLELEDKTPAQLVEYFEACPDVTHIILSKFYNGHNINKLVLQNLPAKVSHLDLNNFDLSGLSLTDFRPSFASGRLKLKSCIIDTFSFAGQLNALCLNGQRSLPLTQLPDLRELVLMNCRDALTLRSLPPNLERLIIQHSTFLDHSLDSLPRLKHLELNVDLSGFSLDHLPSTLESLEIRSKRIPSVDNLPPNLKTVIFTNCDFTGMSLGGLPDSLKSVKFANCSGICLDKLPTSLVDKINKDFVN